MSHIKQQKQIQAFLIEEFGEDKGEALFRHQEDTLDALLKTEKDISKSRMKTLSQMVLPCIALYKALTASSEEDAYAFTRKYMLNKVGAKNHASTAKMEAVPGFYFILFTVTYSLRSCAHPTYGKVIRPITTIPLTLRFMRASGIQPVFSMAVRSCAVFFATLTT